MFRILIIVVMCAFYTSKNAHANIEAIYINNSVQIKWTYAEQKKISYFIIEKSKNGKNFKQFSIVSTDKSNNSFIETDPIPYGGISFYRIRSVNIDGTTFFSETVSIRKLTEYKNLPLKLKNTSVLNTLVVLRDKSNNEFYAKLNIQETNGVLVSETLNENIRTGEFIIIASEKDELVGNKLSIINRNAKEIAVDIANTIHH